MSGNIWKWVPERRVLTGVVLGLLLGSAGMKLSAPILNAILPALIPGIQVSAPKPEASPSDHDDVVRLKEKVRYLERGMARVEGKLDRLGESLGVDLANVRIRERTYGAWADRDHDDEPAPIEETRR